MKKKCIIFFTALFVLSACTKISPETTNSTDDAKAEEIESPANDSSSDVWVKTKQTRYNSDGTIDSYTVYEYDSNGNQIKSTYNDSDGNRTRLYEYNSAGQETKCNTYNANGDLTVLSECEYDSRGNLIKRMLYTSNTYDEYEYDSDGNMIKQMFHLPDGSVRDWYEYAYDSNRDMIKEICHTEVGDYIYLYEYEYDSDGNLIKRAEFIPSEPDNENSERIPSSLSEYEYDSNGNQIKETWHNYSEYMNGWIEYEYSKLNQSEIL